MLILDAHLDLAMNALEWNRDLSRPIEEIRGARAIAGPTSRIGDAAPCRFAEMRRGGVGLCVATLIARYVAPGNPLSGLALPGAGLGQTQGQLAWYRAMEERGEMTPIVDRRRSIGISRAGTADRWSRTVRSVTC